MVFMKKILPISVNYAKALVKIAIQAKRIVHPVLKDITFNHKEIVSNVAKQTVIIAILILLYVILVLISLLG